MTRFTLTVLPDGRSILSTTEEMTRDDVVRAREAFSHWSTEEDHRTLIVPSCEVVRAVDIELVLT